MFFSPFLLFAGVCISSSPFPVFIRFLPCFCFPSPSRRLSFRLLLLFLLSYFLWRSRIGYVFLASRCWQDSSLPFLLLPSSPRVVLCFLSFYIFSFQSFLSAVLYHFIISFLILYCLSILVLSNITFHFTFISFQFFVSPVLYYLSIFFLLVLPFIDFLLFLHSFSDRHSLFVLSCISSRFFILSSNSLFLLFFITFLSISFFSSYLFSSFSTPCSCICAPSVSASVFVSFGPSAHLLLVLRVFPGRSSVIRFPRTRVIFRSYFPFPSLVISLTAVPLSVWMCPSFNHLFNLRFLLHFHGSCLFSLRHLSYLEDRCGYSHHAFVSPSHEPRVR